MLVTTVIEFDAVAYVKGPIVSYGGGQTALSDIGVVRMGLFDFAASSLPLAVVLFEPEFERILCTLPPNL